MVTNNEMVTVILTDSGIVTHTWRETFIVPDTRIGTGR